MSTTTTPPSYTQSKYSTSEVLKSKGKPGTIRLLDLSSDSSTDAELKRAVTNYLCILEREKEAEVEKSKYSKCIRSYIRDVRSYYNKKRIFTKTYRIEGHKTAFKTYMIDVSHSDKYSFSKEKEDIEQLKNAIGKDIFGQIFEIKNTIKIKDVITESEIKRKKFTQDIISVLGIEKLREYFEEIVDYKLKPHLSSRIYDYSPEIQGVLLEYFIPALDSLKDASVPVS